MLSFIIITCAIASVPVSSEPLCTNSRRILDLDKPAPGKTESETYPAFKRSLDIVCKGANFTNKTWTFNSSMNGLFVMDTSDGLVIHIPCAVDDCAVIHFECIGYRLGDKFTAPIDIFPQCAPSTTVTPTNSSDIKLPELLVKEDDIAYLGMIIGFSVCLVLGLLSGLVVCLQKQCSHRKCAMVCGNNCGGGYKASRNTVDDSEQRSAALGAHAIPMLRFHKRFRHGAAAEPYDV